MNIILDTHILIYLLTAPENLSEKELLYLNDNNSKLYFSSISIWEISIKFSLGKMEFLNIDPVNFSELCLESGLYLKNIEITEVGSLYQLPQILNHKDPFDRMLIWQCMKNEFILMSRDKKFDAYKDYGLKTI